MTRNHNLKINQTPKPTVNKWLEWANNPVHEAVLFYWGERCPDHEDGCPVCEAWEQYDNMTDNQGEDE